MTTERCLTAIPGQGGAKAAAEGAKMGRVIPFSKRSHILIVEDDWVIREVLKDHFGAKPNCRLNFLPDLDQALAHLQQVCRADLVLSNLFVQGSEGIDLASACHRNHPCEVLLTTGYNSEADRFRALAHGHGFYRVRQLRLSELVHFKRFGGQLFSWP
jgi:DNA-binding NtrC family response regulator